MRAVASGIPSSFMARAMEMRFSLSERMASTALYSPSPVLSGYVMTTAPPCFSSSRAFFS